MTSAAGRGEAGALRGRAAELRRERILDAVAEVVAERGLAGASVALITRRARVSRRSFEGLFASLEDCLAAVFDLGLERTAELMTDAFEKAETWQGGLRTGLASLLALLDAEPSLARVWLVESLAAGGWALEHRERNLQALRDLVLSSWPGSEDWSSPPLAAEGVLASVLGIVHAHIVAGKPEPLIGLLGPLMGIVAAPYLSPRAVAREIERGDDLARTMQAEHRDRSPWPSAGRQAVCDAEVPTMLSSPNAHRARDCLLFVCDHPSSSNREVAVGIGVAHPSQISRLLRYLLEADLAVKRSEGAGKRNAWQLTARGEEVARALTADRLGGRRVRFPVSRGRELPG